MVEEFVPCERCAGKSVKPGFIDRINKDGYRYFEECPCHKSWRHKKEIQTKIDTLLWEANIRKEYSFEDYIGENTRDKVNEIEIFADHFEEFNDLKALYFYGINGCQKTTVACALGCKLIRRGFTVGFILMQGLINILLKDFKETDEEHSERLKHIERLSKCDLLIIDECFDKTKVNISREQYQLPCLDGFIRNFKNKILFISNIKPEQIDESLFGPSLKNLVIRETPYTSIEFKDYIDKKGNIVVEAPDPSKIFGRRIINKIPVRKKIN